MMSARPGAIPLVSNFADFENNYEAVNRLDENMDVGSKNKTQKSDALLNM